MIRSRFLWLLCLCLPGFVHSETILTLGVFSYRPPAVMAAKYDLLGVYLSGAMPGYRVRVEYLNQVQMEAALAERRLDFVFTNPSHFVLLRHHNRLSGAIATQQSMENGQTAVALGGVIVVPADSPLTSLADLRGRRIAIPGSKFLGGYQAQAFELLQAGIDTTRDVRLLEKGGHDNVLSALLAGEADAGFIRTGMLESLAREGRDISSQLRVLNAQNHPGFPFAVSTRLYPEWAFAAVGHVPEPVVKQVMRALLFITPDMAVAKAASIAGFGIPGDYQSVEMLARSLRLPPYEVAEFSVRDIWQRYAGFIVALAIGLLLIIFLLFRVVTERQRLQGALRRLENIASRVPGMVYEFRRRADGTFCFPYASMAIQDLFGLTPGDVRHDAAPIFALLHPDDLVPVMTSIESSAHAMTLWRDEFRCCLPQGQQRWFAATSLPQREPDGAVLWHGFISDITERKAVEAELAEYRNHLETLVNERTLALSIAKEAAESANRAKSAFLANMSHELRTPMNAIIGLAHLMARAPLDPQQAERLSRIGQAATHLLQLLSDVLELSKIEAEHLTLEKAEFNLGQLIANLDGLLGGKALTKQVALRYEIDPMLREQTLLGDPLRLQQILLNLLGNALKFTEHGEVVLEIATQAAEPDGLTLEFVVRDTGIGMANDVLTRIFEPFEQVDSSTTRRYGGTGLGLSITRHLVRLMGGEIGVASTLGVGSRFSLCLQFAIPGQQERLPASSASLTGSQAEELLRRHFAGTRVLVAEDDWVNQEVIVELLREVLGFAVDLAENGAQAVDLVRENDYALLLMDVQMPELDGIAAARSIRQLPGRETLPIVALTANVFAEDRAACLEAGMDDFVAKPVDPDLLFVALWRVFSRRGLGA